MHCTNATVKGNYADECRNLITIVKKGNDIASDDIFLHYNPQRMLAQYPHGEVRDQADDGGGVGRIQDDETKNGGFKQGSKREFSHRLTCLAGEP